MQLVRRHFVGGGFVCLPCEGNVTDMHLLSTLYFKTSLVITVAVAVFPVGFVINANRYAIRTYICTLSVHIVWQISTVVFLNNRVYFTFFVFKSAAFQTAFVVASNVSVVVVNNLFLVVFKFFWKSFEKVESFLNIMAIKLFCKSWSQPSGFVYNYPKWEW